MSESPVPGQRADPDRPDPPDRPDRPDEQDEPGEADRTDRPDRVTVRSPVRPEASEACRYLCAGTHLDKRFRDTVINELYVHEERFAAPSFGIDAARVLAHALLARRLELRWALAILAVWVAALPLTGGEFLWIMLPSLLFTAVSRTRRRLRRVSPLPRALGTVLRWYVTLMLVAALLTMFPFWDEARQLGFGLLGLLLHPPAMLFSFVPWRELFAWIDWPDPLVPLYVPFLVIAVLVGLRQGGFARLMDGPLSAAHFPDPTVDPAEAVRDGRARRLLALVRREQHSPLAIYDSADPFRGAGEPYEPWTLTVELRPRAGHQPEPVDNRAALERVRPLVEALRTPSPHGSPRAAEVVRDRLRELEVDECVFLPPDGLRRREEAPYDAERFAVQRREAIEEGGEARRHFLRIRVGGWEGELMVTVYVRVHTQGGMLMLEVAPYVLLPVLREFRDADRTAHRYVHNSAFSKAVRALTRTPSSLAGSVVLLGGWSGSGWSVAVEGNRGALPEGPALAVRELGASDEASLFEWMDVRRYLQSIQERVGEGVKHALYDAGWQTAAFEQKIVNVSGGVYIESARNSAFGFGERSTAVTNNNTNRGTGNEQRRQ
ncbi:MULTISPECIES: hypothetical protein [unclassified Streptomyces]|uniref:hypothetical protein n=1 Tax=unclassified Streptomyces TaxID=2593676 RepID=UPI000823AFAD|nr:MULTISPECIES: hypothetical protein [unclassified Streptomyces]SCK06778.1 hypothetical protein YW7DRAFT_00200 [Streptomyces sp. AmelKG-E11A]